MKKTIKDFPNYSITEDGTIINEKTGVIMKMQISKKGYKVIGLSNNGKRKKLSLHRLLFQAFKGQLLDNKVIDHIDNNPLNNDLNNLQQISQRHNTHKDKWRHSPSTPYPGVYFNKHRNTYRAEIYFGNIKYPLGSFKSKELAKQAYDNAITNGEEYTKLIQKKQSHSSLYKGIYFDKQRNLFRARITINNKKHNIGRFKSQNDAIIAIKNYCKINNIVYKIKLN